MIRILIADDQLLFRSMLNEMLTKDAEIEIVSSCSNSEEAIADCMKYKPDIALLDIGMPNIGGISALREIKTALPRTKVAMLTTFEDDENIIAALELGADGYLIKEMTPSALIMAVKCIQNDLILFHNGTYRVLQSALELSQNTRAQKREIGDIVFDMADISIMKLIVQGKSNKDIAASLNYSEGTIKNKISKMLSVTGLSDRTGLSVFAINNDII